MAFRNPTFICRFMRQRILPLPLIRKFEMGDIYEIEVDGRIIRIPSEVIEERMRLMHIDSVEKAIEDVKIMSEAFASSLSNEEKCASDFEKRVFKFLDCDIDVYRR